MVFDFKESTGKIPHQIKLISNTNLYFENKHKIKIDKTIVLVIIKTQIYNLF